MQRRAMRQAEQRRVTLRRRQLVWLTTMWAIIAVVGSGVAGVGIGVATGAIQIFRPSAAGVPFTPKPLPTATIPTPAPAPTLAPEPTVEPTPTEPVAPPASPASQGCATQTTMSVMAHYDDDLIFANPTMLRAIQAGECVRTVFVTGGDAGKGLEYATTREQGILAAYDVLRGLTGPWTAEQITLYSGMPITRYTPADNPNISVTFLRLPDGNLKGEGFEATGWESLERLYAETIGSMHTIDTQVKVTEATLQASLQELIAAYVPASIITLVPGDSRFSKHDHSDHSTVGLLMRTAWQNSGVPAEAVKYATGYGNKRQPINVSGPELDLKLLAFWTYAQHDSVSACASPQACLELEPFGRSLEREYFLTDAELY